MMAAPSNRLLTTTPSPDPPTIVLDVSHYLVRKIDDKYDYKIVPGRSKTLIIDLTAVEEI